MDAAVRAFDPKIQWTEPATFPGGRAYHGTDEAKRYLKQSREAWAEVISEPEQFINAGDRHGSDQRVATLGRTLSLRMCIRSRTERQSKCALLPTGKRPCVGRGPKMSDNT
jgi:hypothetical protein